MVVNMGTLCLNRKWDACLERPFLKSPKRRPFIVTISLVEFVSQIVTIHTRLELLPFAKPASFEKVILFADLDDPVALATSMLPLSFSYLVGKNTRQFYIAHS